MTTASSRVTLITQVNSSDAAVGSGGSASQADGQVAPLPDGGYVVVWTDSSRQPATGGNPLGSAIIAQRYDSSGAKVGGEVKISQFNSGDQFAPAIAALQNGNVAIAFTDAFSGDDDIYVRIFSPTLTLVRTDIIDMGTNQTYAPAII